MSIANADPLIDDVWLMILPFLDTSTLNSISRTSFHFQSLFRPFLYRDLHLYFDSRHTASTLRLLHLQEDLALQITRLTLYASDGEVIPRILSQLIETLGKMTSLKAINMPRSVFLSYSGCSSLLDKIQWFNSHSNLANVSSLTWDITMVYDNLRELVQSSSVSLERGLISKLAVWRMNPVWKILDTSRKSLRHISFPSTVPSIVEYNRLWHTHFPSLRSFNVGPWKGGAPVRSELTSFLHSHNNTLEELSFSHYTHAGERDTDPSFMPFADLMGAFQEDLLPHLKSLRGNIGTVQLLYVHELHSFRTGLEILDLTIGGWLPTIFQQEFLRQAFRTSSRKSPPLLSSVRTLNLTLHKTGGNGPLVMFCLDTLMHCLGDSVEIFKLVSSVSIDTDILVFHLGRAARLREVYLSLSVEEEDTHEDFTLLPSMLSQTCHKLREVWFLPSGKASKEGAKCFRIQRSSSNGVIGIE